MDGSKNPSALFGELRDRLLDADWSRWSEDEFESRALAAFRHQFHACAPYGAFCSRRGVTPDTVASWEDIPEVPATAFKFFDFVSAPTDGGVPEATFVTSGTTRGADARGRHHVPRLDLYRASLAEPFRRALLPELPPVGVGGAHGSPDDGALFISLIPSPTDAPTSSLSCMVGAAGERFARDVLWLVDGEGAWREGEVQRVGDSLDVATRRSEPVLLLGTALSFVHLLEAADIKASQVGGPGQASPAAAAALRALPPETRVMETGGFKGSRREISRDALYRGIAEATGVHRDRIVNEYGMTELLSQLYQSQLHRGGDAEGLHRPPPWLRVRALDPVTLKPVPEGQDGILAFFDLANLGSVCHVLTEDVGSVHDGGVRLRGRAPGSEPRGCSRALDDLMTAARG